jgi:hypothetical protein
MKIRHWKLLLNNLLLQANKLQLLKINSISHNKVLKRSLFLKFRKIKPIFRKISKTTTLNKLKMNDSNQILRIINLHQSNNPRIQDQRLFLNQNKNQFQWKSHFPSQLPQWSRKKLKRNHRHPNRAHNLLWCLLRPIFIKLRKMKNLLSTWGHWTRVRISTTTLLCSKWT